MADAGGYETVDEARAEAVERLQRLATGGALTPEELADRIRRGQSAMTRAGIDQAFVGLPAEPGSDAGSGSGSSASSRPMSSGWAAMEPPPPAAAPPAPVPPVPQSVQVQLGPMPPPYVPPPAGPPPAPRPVPARTF